MIILSSDSEEDGSDVEMSCCTEIIAQYSNFLSRTEPLPRQDVEVRPDAANVNAPMVSPPNNLDKSKVFQK